MFFLNSKCISIYKKLCGKINICFSKNIHANQSGMKNETTPTISAHVGEAENNSFTDDNDSQNSRNEVPYFPKNNEDNGEHDLGRKLEHSKNGERYSPVLTNAIDPEKTVDFNINSAKFIPETRNDSTESRFENDVTVNDHYEKDIENDGMIHYKAPKIAVNKGSAQFPIARNYSVIHENSDHVFTVQNNPNGSNREINSVGKRVI